MGRVRLAALSGLLMLVLGSLALTAGYASYLRSGYYRNACAADLSAALGLPSEIGSVTPRSRTTREFGDVTVWLPDRRGPAMFCERAVVVQEPRPDDPEAYDIELHGGMCEISPRTWLKDDYRRVIESGLRPGFAPGGPRCVRFSGMDVRFARENFTGTLENAAGVVEFRSATEGLAAAACHSFNGYIVPWPASLRAEFRSEPPGILIAALCLDVPELPVSVLDLGGLLGADVRSGTFSGKLVYGEDAAGGRRLTLCGRCSNISLAECTAGLAPRPWAGQGVMVELQDLTFDNDRPERLRFGGVLSGVRLGDILAPWGLADVGGETTLRVREADLTRAGIQRFVASGECEAISLAALTIRLGRGVMIGNARLRIDDLTIEDNRLRSADLRLMVDETPDPNWIEGRLVVEIVNRMLKMTLPAVLLPERIEYTRLGLRVEVRDEVLYVFGSHGPDQRTILTVRLLERDFPLLHEPSGPADCTVWFDALRARARDWVQRRVERLEYQGWPILDGAAQPRPGATAEAQTR